MIVYEWGPGERATFAIRRGGVHKPCRVRIEMEDRINGAITVTIPGRHRYKPGSKDAEIKRHGWPVLHVKRWILESVEHTARDDGEFDTTLRLVHHGSRV